MHLRRPSQSEETWCFLKPAAYQHLAPVDIKLTRWWNLSSLVVNPAVSVGGNANKEYEKMKVATILPITMIFHSLCDHKNTFRKHFYLWRSCIIHTLNLGITESIDLWNVEFSIHGLLCLLWCLKVYSMDSGQMLVPNLNPGTELAWKIKMLLHFRKLRWYCARNRTVLSRLRYQMEKCCRGKS